MEVGASPSLPRRTASAPIRCNIRPQYLTNGLDAVLHDQRQERRRAALTGAQQAHLIEIACSPAPEGHDRWALCLLAGKAIELGFVEHIVIETTRDLLKTTSSSPGSMSTGASQRRGRSSWRPWRTCPICKTRSMPRANLTKERILRLASVQPLRCPGQTAEFRDRKEVKRSHITAYDRQQHAAHVWSHCQSWGVRDRTPALAAQALRERR
jgi:hypothetical protein